MLEELGFCKGLSSSHSFMVLGFSIFWWTVLSLAVSCLPFMGFLVSTELEEPTEKWLGWYFNFLQQGFRLMQLKRGLAKYSTETGQIPAFCISNSNITNLWLVICMDSDAVPHNMSWGYLVVGDNGGTYIDNASYDGNYYCSTIFSPYVRPGASPIPGAATMGPGGTSVKVRAPVSMVLAAGRGRGDWRPIGIKGPAIQKGPK
ncbi:hypothetical protein ACH5RR_003538 [Cinchona calisaya]|uniref:Neprosin domain-containing protein n=1 Tax=Cinchona calisaya TaxID=153742 RepID=A0ABD3AVU1_9GENT